MSTTLDQATALDPETAKPGTRIVVVPDSFLRKLGAIMVATIFHPFTTTIVRVIKSADRISLEHRDYQ
jgi:hypothetical protein